MPINSGQTNLNINSAPGAYWNFLNPNPVGIPGANTNLAFIVGIADGGLVNRQMAFSGVTDASKVLGNVTNRTYDIMTAIDIASKNGAAQFVVVRVTDGTDAAATATIVDTTTPTPVVGVTLTAKYTGTVSNSLFVSVSQGSNFTSGTPTYRVTIYSANGVGEVFDNIGGTANALYANIVSAINNGNNTSSASDLVVATLGAATLAPTLTTTAFEGGTSGNTTITPAVLLGNDTGSKTGMYAGRGCAASVGMLCDVSDTTTFDDQALFGTQEGIEMVGTGASAQTTAQFITSQQTIGLFSNTFKYIKGDWCYYNDTYNNIPGRVVSPQAYYVGLRASLSPEQPSFNRALVAVQDTQTTRSGGKYLPADISSILANRGDVIYRPSPGGTFFAMQTGVNTSDNIDLRYDQTTILTYYIYNSLNPILGTFIGQLNSPTIRNQIDSRIKAFFSQMYRNGQIGATNSTKESDAYDVRVTSTNQQAEEGILQIDMQVANFPPISTMLVNLQNGNITLASSN